MVCCYIFNPGHQGEEGGGLGVGIAGDNKPGIPGAGQLE